MTKEDVDNLDKILSYFDSIDHTHTEGISHGTGLDHTFVEKYIPTLINRECIISVSETGSPQPAYKITNPGKEYLYGKKFQEEYENEIKAQKRENFELELLQENIKNSKFMKWNIFFAAINTAILIINLFFLFNK
jgi:predicted transcriptional regulator